MQAKDITDETMLEALAAVRGRNGVPRWSSLFDLLTVESLLTVPRKVVLAKLSSMIQRGLIDGCDCGCRGDFEVPTADGNSTAVD